MHLMDLSAQIFHTRCHLVHGQRRPSSSSSSLPSGSEVRSFLQRDINSIGHSHLSSFPLRETLKPFVITMMPLKKRTAPPLCTPLASGQILEEDVPITNKNLQVVGAAVLTIILAVANRALHKLALVPLKNYPFFLAQLSTFGYVIVYFTILFARYRAGIVTDEMLALPKLRFVAIGMLEALGVAAGMASAAVLPGAALPILAQTFLVWQLLLSITFLGKRYSFSQILGCAMVIAGVVIALTSGGGASGKSLLEFGYLWPMLMVSASALQAGASIIKEFVFQDAKNRMKGQSVDIFVVNSFGSGFQALFVLLMLPFLSNLRGIPFSELPSYFDSGTTCFFNAGSLITECQGAPFLPLLYIAVNMSFNISLLRLLKLSSAVVSSLSTTVSVPLSIYIFTLPLPYIGEPAVLSSRFLLGVVLLLVGLAYYNFFGHAKKLLLKTE